MYEILFVDDDIQTAREFAELVERFTKLRAFVCSTRADALEAASKYPIAVAVLDQRMPEIPGTELYQELLKYNHQTRAIMLSGEADQSEIGTAINLEYSKYVHKSDVLQLPGLVLQEYVRFQNEKSKTNKFERAYLFSVRHWFGLRGSTEFWLESFLTEDENHIVPDSWKIADQINSGEKKQIKEKVELSSELKFEQNLETEISANAEVAWEAVGKIKTKLGAVLKEKVAASSVLKEGITKESIREITLPEEPKNPSELHVRSRGFYWAPVHRKIQCHISKIMWPMNERNSLSITVLQPTGRVATKQKDILSDGTTREIFTGVHGI